MVSETFQGCVSEVKLANKACSREAPGLDAQERPQRRDRAGRERRAISVFHASAAARTCSRLCVGVPHSQK